MVNLKAGLDRFGSVVGTTSKFGAAASVADAVAVRSAVAVMKACPAPAAGEPSRQAIDQCGFVDIEQDHMVQLEPAPGEHRIECLRLRHRAWKAVEDEP